MANGLNNHRQKDSPTRLIIEHLQRQGPATIKELETLLGVTTTAVRQHLSALLAEGYIRRQAVHAGVGRPHHTYAVTEKTRDLYACHCDDLALTLLEEVFALEGKERAAALLDRVGNRLADRYSRSVRSIVLLDRVEELAAELEQRGVLTGVAAEEGGIVLRTFNCPYHELAQEHREICAMDEKMMRDVLGSDVSLSACIMDGHNGCTFLVQRPGARAAAKGADTPA